MTRKLLFLMTAEQAQGFADRMRAADSGDGAVPLKSAVRSGCDLTISQGWFALP